MSTTYDRSYYERRRIFSDSEKGKVSRSRYNDWYLETKADILYTCGNIFALDSMMPEMKTLTMTGKLIGCKL